MCFIEDSKKQLGTVLQNRVGANEHHRKKVFTGKSMGGPAQKLPQIVANKSNISCTYVEVPSYFLAAK